MHKRKSAFEQYQKYLDFKDTRWTKCPLCYKWTMSLCSPEVNIMFFIWKISTDSCIERFYSILTLLVRMLEL